MTPQAAWIDAVRTSHERFRDVLDRVEPTQYGHRAYPADWSIAQVASHLGSQAEIFGLFLDAGLAAGTAPDGDDFKAVWARWDAMAPADQVSESVVANDRFVARLEEVASSGAPFEVELFGGPSDLSGVAAARLAEHAVHTWDVEVVLDPAATVGPEAVDLLVDRLPGTVAFAGRPSADVAPTSVVLETHETERRFRLDVDADAIRLEPVDAAAATASGGESSAGTTDVVLPAESLVRLVYGRLDAEHTPDDVTGAEHLPALRAIFPGF
ncbi:maleylpyruvate isomerase family mycothiol-dependent enzyme [Terrabacter sp. Ter38]|uniref:maleylpyruvate isomerase family mycothiol-dependent enzyme n=1 Tax=Terrabacter sp. Ter38 TaxID=2926030 RepID=UPI0021190ECD|nr:maleylpyruvate isomerase family mycothiol-dependent enzyme [Terrabacter sp. Ter38]